MKFLVFDAILNHISDGSENPKGKVYHLKLKYTDVGSDHSMPIRVGINTIIINGVTFVNLNL